MIAIKVITVILIETIKLFIILIIVLLMVIIENKIFLQYVVFAYHMLSLLLNNEVRHM